MYRKLQNVGKIKFAFLTFNLMPNTHYPPLYALAGLGGRNVATFSSLYHATAQPILRKILKLETGNLNNQI
jgi:hypothetical protein